MSGIVHLTDDLIFSSRVMATARAVGQQYRAARNLEAVVQLLQTVPASCVIVDIHLEGLEIVNLIKRLRGVANGVKVVAYGSHVDAGSLSAARKAGCDLVLPRSAFVERLETELPVWCGGTAIPSE